MRKHIPPQSLFFLVGEEITHCPLTVPRGDTPCVTAGDARRANPWRSEEVERENGEGEKKETSQPAPTVPSGDTPCVTAGDARRANPWDGDADNFPTPAVSHNTHSCYSLNACSATPPASEFSESISPRVHPRSARASPAVKHGAPPPEA